MWHPAGTHQISNGFHVIFIIKKLEKNKIKNPAPVGIPFSEMHYINFNFFVMWHPAGTHQISVGYHGILRHLTVGITQKTKSGLKCEISAQKKQLLVTSDLLVTSGMITYSSIRVREVSN